MRFRFYIDFAVRLPQADTFVGHIFYLKLHMF